MTTRTVPEIPAPTEVKRQILAVIQDSLGTYQPAGRIAYTIGNPPDGATVQGVECIQQITPRIVVKGGSDASCWDIETDIILIAHQRAVIPSMMKAAYALMASAIKSRMVSIPSVGGGDLDKVRVTIVNNFLIHN